MMKRYKPFLGLSRWLFGVVISLAVITILAYNVDWRQTLIAFEDFNWFVIPQFMIAYFFSAAARAMASRKLLENQPTFEQSFTSLTEGYLLNNLFPFRLGELGRAYLLSRKANLNMLQVLSANIVERIFDLILAASLLISTFPLVFEMDWIRPVAYTTLVVMVFALFSLNLVLRFRNPILEFLKRTLARFDFATKVVLPRLYSAFDGLSALGNLRDLLFTLGWMLLSWIFNILAFMFILRHFFPHSPFYWSIFVVGVVSFAAAIPSAPAALGVLEGAVVVALVFLGEPSGLALAYAVVLHFFSILMTVILGVYSFSRETESIWQTYERLIARKDNP